MEPTKETRLNKVSGMWKPVLESIYTGTLNWKRGREKCWMETTEEMKPANEYSYFGVGILLDVKNMGQNIFIRFCIMNWIRATLPYQSKFFICSIHLNFKENIKLCTYIRDIQEFADKNGIFFRCLPKMSVTSCTTCIRRSLGSSRKSVHERPRNSDGWQVKWSVFWAIWLKSQDP